MALPPFISAQRKFKMVVTADLLVFREICEHRSGGYRPCTQNPVGGARLTEARHLLLTIIFYPFARKEAGVHKSDITEVNVSAVTVEIGSWDFWFGLFYVFFC